ncbi:MAG: di-heme oxidoredictase family protein, partial [Polyangiales bacterium]
MTIKSRALVSLLLGSVLLPGCPDPIDPPLPPVAEGIFAPMGEIRPSATEEERATFARGEEVARRRFTPEMGLGPSFNVTFCGACHEKPVFGGSAGRYRDFLLVEQIVSDGSRVALGSNGVLPQYNLETGRRPTEEAANHFGRRNPIPFFGVGLLAEIPEEAILANADADDADGDGISGRPNVDRGFV